MIDGQKALELDKVLARLAEHAVSDPGREMCVSLVPHASAAQVRQALAETDSAVVLLRRYGAPGLGALKPVVSSCRRAAGGAVLGIRELIEIADLLRISGALSRYGGEDKGALAPYFARVTPLPELETRLSGAFPTPEEVADQASPALRDIRRKQGAARARIRAALDSYLKNASKYLQESLVTVRNDRYVIPVKVEYRNEIPGLVHDTSSSGATLFVEPLPVVNANNELAVLAAEERREIERILAAFSEEVGRYSALLLENYHGAAALDLAFAKARYAEDLRASCPEVNTEGRIQLRAARHPLLNRETVVPIDLTLGTDYTVLVVTGPNTGGKTVSLKTAGLLCLMAACGLFIPAAERSEVAFFQKIFADIGDEQSIEQSLSTFSAHMKNIIQILREVDGDSLVLLDELGSGTDPAEGAALAVAIIEQIQSLGARVMATTHYAELKLFALQAPGVENASCEFDVVSLAPTYRLLIGIPGKSNAFAIVKRLGMDDLVIESAKYRLDHETVRMEAVLADLETERRQLEHDAEQARLLKQEAEQLLRNAEETQKRWQNNAEEITAKARRQAAAIVEQARRDSDRLLDSLDELRRQKDREEFRENLAKAKSVSRQQLDQMEARYEEKRVKKPLPRPLREGDEIRVLSLNKTGMVLSLPDSKGKLTVQVGIIKTKVSADDVELVERPAPRPKPAAASYKLERGSRTVSNELDIRGMNVLEAEPVVEGFLDNCRMAGLTTVSIIHGKGTGQLRNGIHGLLRRIKYVEGFRLGVYGEGETGVTIVTLKG